METSLEIVQGVHLVKVPLRGNPLGFLNCYLIAGKDGWLMVDTGWHTPEALDTLQAGLQQLGLTFTDIATIVVTHVHADHFGLAGRLKQLSPSTKLFAHHWEWALIESRYIRFADLRHKMEIMLRHHGVPDLNIPALEAASMPAMQFVAITMPDEPLYGGEILNTGVFSLEVIWTPGHSPGHICLYEPHNQLLFAGDHILPGITPNINYHVQSGDNPLGDFIYALQKVRNLAVAKVLPAHEHVFHDLPGRIGEILKHHDRRKEEIRRTIQEKPRVAYEIAPLITWDIPDLTWEQFPPLHQRSAVAETIAHLEYMRWEGTVTRIDRDGLFLYRAG
jgi:glyoxylase-like metal-dependent hydrolase (beta-lactamase superfamily II)